MSTAAPAPSEDDLAARWEAELSDAEEDDLAMSTGKLTLHEVTPSAVVIELLEIEELQ